MPTILRPIRSPTSRPNGYAVLLLCAIAIIAAILYGLYLVVVHLICCRGKDKKARCVILWGWVIGIGLTAGLCTSLVWFGPHERNLTETDMVHATLGLSPLLCTGVTVQSPDSQFDAYLLPKGPDFLPYPQDYKESRDIFLDSNELVYQGFYLLKGTTVTVKNSLSGQLDVYVVKGKKKVSAWENNKFSSSSFHASIEDGDEYEFEAKDSDEYNFVYINNGVYGCDLSTLFELNRVYYDTSNAVRSCESLDAGSSCDLTYSNVVSSESVVVTIDSADDAGGYATLKTECKRRVWMFVLIFALIPLLLGANGTLIIKYRFRESKNIVSNESHDGYGTLSGQKSTLEA